MNINGRLIYTDGGGNINAIQIDSSESELRRIYSSNDIVAINALTNVDSGIMLFDECSGRCNITQIFMNTGKVQVLHSGRLPSYISEHESLFFYDKASDGSSWLFMAPMRDINLKTKVAKEPEWRILPNGISMPIAIAALQTSSDEVIFLGEGEQLWKYNIAREKKKPMNIGNCLPLAWIEEYGQLLCSDFSAQNVFLLDPDSRIEVKLPELKGAYGFVYVPGTDFLVYGRTRPSFFIWEAYDIFIYSLKDKKEKMIKRNSHISDGVWLQ
jgi:hypothetical protein